MKDFDESFKWVEGREDFKRKQSYEVINCEHGLIAQCRDEVYAVNRVEGKHILHSCQVRRLTIKEENAIELFGDGIKKLTEEKVYSTLYDFDNFVGSDEVIEVGYAYVGGEDTPILVSINGIDYSDKVKGCKGDVESICGQLLSVIKPENSHIRDCANLINDLSSEIVGEKVTIGGLKI